MAFIRILFWLCFLPVVVTAQTPVNDGWIQSGSAAESSELYSVAFVSADIGYAVGSGGACLKTINGGVAWSPFDLGVPYDLLKITFLNANTGFIAGGFGNRYGKVLKTIDGGSTWVEVLHFNDRMNDMFFLDALHGWIASYDQVLFTDDGGLSWTTRGHDNFYDILSIVFVTPGIGFLAPNNASIGVQITRDGGITWNPSFNTYTNDLDYTDETTIYTMKGNSPGMVYKTTDQGGSWNSFSTGLSGSLKGIKFVSPSTGFVWSTDPHFGKIFRTADAGQQWSLVYNNPSADIHFVTATPEGRYIAVGSGGLILSSTNGTNWDTAHVGNIRGTLRRVAFTGNLTGIAVGERGSVIKTIDGGISWTPVDLGIRQDLAGLDFVNEKVGYMAGDESTLYKTVNGGSTWALANNGLDTPELFQIAAWDERKAYAASNNGIFVTHNGGSTWTQTSYTSIAYDIFLAGADTILAAGFAKFRCSSDGGSAWTDRSVPRTFFSMYFTSSAEGLIGDSWGRVHKTDDNGQNWQQVHNCNSAIYDMTFINDTTGYFVADNGYIGMTHDGGQSWFQVESGTLRNLRSIFFTADGTGHIVGKDGIILRKAAPASSSPAFPITVPVNIYPNPASGVLHISTGVLVPGKVEIIDLFGRTVWSKPQCRVSGKDYEIDISPLDPGLYHIRLQIGNTLIVKKLIIR